MIHIDFYLNVRNILLIILTIFMTIKIYSFVMSFRTDDIDDIACTRKISSSAQKYIGNKIFADYFNQYAEIVNNYGYKGELLGHK